MKSEAIVKHPYILAAAACLICLFCTAGQYADMRPFGEGIVLFCLGELLAWISCKSRKEFLPASALSLALAIAGSILNFEPQLMFYLGLFILLAAAFYGRYKKTLDTEKLVTLILIFGFWVKLNYVLYTDVATRQNDMGTFEEGVYNLFHSGYIMYVRDNLSLPDVDVRQAGQFYHPPFHYFVCAIFLRIYEAVVGGKNYESLQFLSLCYSQIATILIVKSSKELGVKKDNLPTVTLVLSAFPALILLSGSVNNDILSFMLVCVSFYMALKWYNSGTYKDACISAVAAGLAMMTKLSAALIAVPLAVLFIARFIQKDKIKTILTAVVYAAISIPLGLWFQIRNYLKFGVPLTYVLPSDNPYQDISGYSVWQRLFGFYNLPVEDFFINLGSDGQKDYNIAITFIKTALFGEENYRDDMELSLIGYFLLWTFVALIILILAGLVISLIQSRKAPQLSVAAYFLTVLLSYNVFAIKYPHICSMNFRYTMPLVLCGAYCLGVVMEKNPKLKKVTHIICAAFAVLSVAFYIVVQYYVKGEVTVAEVVP